MTIFLARARASNSNKNDPTTTTSQVSTVQKRITRSFSSLFLVCSLPPPSICRCAAAAPPPRSSNERTPSPPPAPPEGVAFVHGAARAFPRLVLLPQRAARRRLVWACGTPAPRARARDPNAPLNCVRRTRLNGAPLAEEPPPDSLRDGKTFRHRRFGRGCARITRRSLVPRAPNRRARVRRSGERLAPWSRGRSSSTCATTS